MTHMKLCTTKDPRRRIACTDGTSARNMVVLSLVLMSRTWDNEGANMLLERAGVRFTVQLGNLATP